MESKIASTERVELGNDEMLLHKAISVVYMTLLKEFDDFAQKYADVFCFEDDDNDEHRLEWTEAFQEFEEMMERKLAKFCKDEGLDGVRDLYFRISDVCENNDSGERCQRMVGLLLAGTSYSKFIKLMKRYCSKNHKKK